MQLQTVGKLWYEVINIDVPASSIRFFRHLTSGMHRVAFLLWGRAEEKSFGVGRGGAASKSLGWVTVKLGVFLGQGSLEDFQGRAGRGRACIPADMQLIVKKIRVRSGTLKYPF